MTKGELIKALTDDTPDEEVVVETRFKTGYDAGDIFHAAISNVNAYKEKSILVLGGSKLVGGW